MELMMHQEQLPLYPNSVTVIANNLTFKKENNLVTYFNYSMPVFQHDADDIRTFRMITSQFYINGNATQAEISRAFGVTLISVKRSVKLYRTRGPKGFYEPRVTRGASILTTVVLAEIQDYLNRGVPVSEIAENFEIKKNTLQKAILEGRLYQVKKRLYKL
jgi:transposase-like protein